MGRISIAFDPSGKIVSYEGEPLRLTNTTAQDPQLKAEVEEWRQPFDAMAQTVVGNSSVLLNESNCQTDECEQEYHSSLVVLMHFIGTLGNVITDAMYEYRKNLGANVDAAIINAGGIRASISAGAVTRGEILTSFPFMNSVVDLVWSGRQILEIFEGIVSTWSTLSHHETTSFVQVSKQIKFSWNANNANQTKLITFEINGNQIDVNKNYTLVALDFMATGGDYLWAPRLDFSALE